MYSAWKQLIGDPLLPQVWPPRARIGINGFGELARMLLRCSLTDNRGIDVVAINDPKLTPEQMIYMFEYNTTNGKFEGHVSHKVNVIPAKPDKFGEHCVFEVAGRLIAVFHYNNFSDIPWHWLEAEYILETTGKCTSLKCASEHLKGGRARKVLVLDDTLDIPLLMYPISCRGYQRGTSIVATGSAMAHAVATLVSLVESTSLLAECLVTIILPVDSEQNLVDGPSQDKLNWRRGRGCCQSIIPGRCPMVVQSVLQAIPQLRARFDAITMHVPTFQGAVVDLTVRTNENITNANEAVEILTRSPLLQRYNLLHVSSHPYQNSRTVCQAKQRQQLLATGSIPSSLIDQNRHDSDQTESTTSIVGSASRTEHAPALDVPPEITSILLPLTKDEAYVSTDSVGKHTMSLLNVDCCLSLNNSTMIKFVTGFDLGISYCERILDTIVFMRGIDHG